MATTSSARITSVVPRKHGQTGPILVSFEHGRLSADTADQDWRGFGAEILSEPAAAAAPTTMTTAAQTKRSPTAAAAATDQSEDPFPYRLALTDGHVTYSNRARSVTGWTVEKEEEFQTTWLAIRNKRTNTVQLVQATRVRVGAEVTPPLSSNPVLVEQERASLAETGRDDEGRRRDNEEKNLDDKRVARRSAAGKKLIGDFGRSKGQRSYDQNDKMAVEKERLHEKLAELARDVDCSRLRVDEPESPALVLTPPCHRDATRPNDVYLVDQMLAKKHLRDLEEQADLMRLKYPSDEAVAEAVDNRRFSELFATLLRKQIGRPEPMSLAVGLYMECIWKFLRIQVDDFENGFKRLPYFVTAKIKKLLLKNFLGPSGVGWTPETRDRAICHAIIAGLMANNYRLDFNALTVSVKDKPDRLKRLVAVVGAHVVPQGIGVNTVVLQLPLAMLDPNAPERLQRPRKKARR